MFSHWLVTYSQSDKLLSEIMTVSEESKYFLIGKLSWSSNMDDIHTLFVPFPIPSKKVKGNCLPLVLIIQFWARNSSMLSLMR